MRNCCGILVIFSELLTCIFDLQFAVLDLLFSTSTVCVSVCPQIQKKNVTYFFVPC